MTKKKDPIIPLHPDDVELSRRYALEVYDTISDERKRRGQFNKEKTLEDERMGKQTEFAVQILLQDYDLKPSEPDIKVYTKEKKYHGTDIFCSKGKVSVKSYRKHSIGSPSWVFEKSYVERAKRQNHEGHYLAMGLWENGKVEVLGIIDFSLLVEYNLFKEMRNKNLHTKTAIYWNDIKKLTESSPDKRWAIFQGEL